MDLGQIFDQIKKILNIALFKLSSTDITVSLLLTALGIILIFYIASYIINRIVLKRLLTGLKIEEGTRYMMLRISHYIIMVVGIFFALDNIGVNLAGFGVIFGLLSVGIGFGLQNITSNFVAGLILLFERPIQIGDRVSVAGTEGDVMEINIRSTTIRSINNVSIIVPNSEFVSTNVINWSHGDTKIRLDVEVGVSYNSDLEKVLTVLRTVADEHPKVLKHPEPDVLLTNFGDSAWDMKLRTWISNPKIHHKIKSELNCAIVHAFRENNIEIPFPQRDLHLRSPEILKVKN
jgi:small-conductance mechanosensitive channel